MGNGTLVYVANHLTSVTPADVAHTPRQFIYRSADAGQSWGLVDAIPEETGHGWASLDSHAPSDRIVVAQVTDDAPPAEVRVLVSEDAGLTFSDPQTVAELQGPTGPQVYPSVGVGSDSIYVTWNEQAAENSTASSRLRLARSTDGGSSWDVTEIGSGGRAFAYPWISVGPSGELGLSVYEADPVPVGPTTNWSVVAGIEADPVAGEFVPTLSLADPDPVLTAQEPDALKDFHQNAFGPDGSLHIAYVSLQEGEPFVRWVQTGVRSGPDSGTSP